MSKPRPRSHFAEGHKQAADGFVLAGGFAFAVAFFWLIGLWVGRRIGLDPWLQLAGIVIGWVVGFMHVYYWTREVDKK